MLSDGYVLSKWYCLLLIACNITCHARNIPPPNYNFSQANSATSLSPTRSRIESYKDITSDSKTRLSSPSSDNKHPYNLQPVLSNIEQQSDSNDYDDKKATIRSDLYESKESSLPTEVLDNNDGEMTLNDINSIDSDSKSSMPKQTSFRIDQDVSQSLPEIKDFHEDLYSQDQKLSYSNPELASDDSQLNQVNSDIKLAARSKAAYGMSSFAQDENQESNYTLFIQDSNKEGKQVTTDLIDSYAEQQKQSETAAAAPHELTAVEGDDKAFTEQAFSDSAKGTDDIQNSTFETLFDAKNQPYLSSLSTDGESQKQDDVSSNSDLLKNYHGIATQTYTDDGYFSETGLANQTSQNAQYNILSNSQDSLFDQKDKYDNQTDFAHQPNLADGVSSSESTQSFVVDAQDIIDNSSVTLDDQSNEEHNSTGNENVSDSYLIGSQNTFEPTNQEYEQSSEKLNLLGTENDPDNTYMDAPYVSEPENQEYEQPNKQSNPIGTENVSDNTQMEAQYPFEPTNQEYEEPNEEMSLLETENVSNSTDADAQVDFEAKSQEYEQSNKDLNPIGTENVPDNTQMNSEDVFEPINQEYKQPNGELNTISTDIVTDNTYTDPEYAFEAEGQAYVQSNEEINSFDTEDVSDNTQIEDQNVSEPTNQEYEQPNKYYVTSIADGSSHKDAFESITAQVQELEPKENSPNQAEEGKSDDIEDQNEFETENEDLQSNLLQENNQIEDTSRDSSILENADKDELNPLEEQTSTADLSSLEENRDSIMETIVNTANSTMEKYGKKASFAVLLMVLVVLFTVILVLVRKCRRHRFNKRKAREIHRQEKEFLLQKQGDGRYVRDGFLNNDESSEDEL